MLKISFDFKSRKDDSTEGENIQVVVKLLFITVLERAQKGGRRNAKLAGREKEKRKLPGR